NAVVEDAARTRHTEARAVRLDRDPRIHRPVTTPDRIRNVAFVERHRVVDRDFQRRLIAPPDDGRHDGGATKGEREHPPHPVSVTPLAGSPMTTRPARPRAGAAALRCSASFR